MPHRHMMPSEQSKRDLFVAAIGDTCRCEQYSVMERSFLSLAEARHPAPTCLVHLAVTFVRVPVQPEPGRSVAEVGTLVRSSRRYVGCEIDAEIAECARTRIAGVLPFDKVGTP